jgi:2-polyprenyl-3-methyl-5-hydroxy-6-metoxy-1,4-benzoquinol methylase
VASSRYSQIVDLDNWNSSHSLAVLSVPPGSRVLDLGAADGSVARALKKRDCTVWGIEQDRQAAEAASQVCDRVIVADLEAKEAFEPLGSETFDVVLALDVLEHLRDPAPVLKCAASYLTPGGIAVVSIPNVTHGALRLSLLEGRFNYTEQGLLDRTHLRFFDRHAAEQLISEAGLTISQRLRVRRELEETEIAVNKDGLPIELLQSLASDPDATTYQFVFVAGRTYGSAITHSGGMLSERLLAENEGVRAQFKELERYTKNLEADLAVRLDAAARELKEYQDELAQAQSMQARATAESLEVQRERDELRQELIRRTQEAHQMHRDLRHSKADGVVKEAFISDLRQQLLAIDPLVSQRDQLARGYKRLSAKCEQLVARRHQLVEERGRLLARQEALETKLRALQTYVNSAGFRIVESVTRHLRRFPTAFRTTRTIARKVVGRGAAAD